MVFFLLASIKVYIDFVWMLNTFTIQGNQSGENSVFFNGMILGCVSLIAFLTSDLVMRFFNVFNLQLFHAIGCFCIMAFKMGCYLTQDSMTASELSLTSRISLLLSYVVTFSVDQTFNCYLQCNLKLIPSNLQFLAIECQLAISFCVL